MAAVTEPQPAPPRLRSLDGLRGLAALAVAFAHVLAAASPTVADSFLTERVDVPTFSAKWWLLKTPLQIVSAGHAAVVTFFVLSGFVLALPLARGGAFSARAYYPRRLLRLYLPVWAALALAALLHLAFDREPSAAASWWLNAHALPMTAEEAVRNATLYRPGGWSFTSVLWSLRWEVAFSMALPLYVYLSAVAVRRRLTVLALAAALVVMTVGERGSLVYLPCFLLGTLLAYEEARIAALRARLAGDRPLRIALLAAAVLLLTSQWWGGIGERAGRAPVALGAALAVALAIAHPWLRGLLERRPVQWVGRRSFSFYLVHEPIVVTLAFLLGGNVTVIVLAAVALPVALLASDLFFRLVERPALHLSRRVGRADS